MLALLPVILAIASSVLGTKYIVTVKDDVDLQAHTSWVSSVHRRNADVGLDGLKRYRVIPAYYGEFDEQTLQTIQESDEVASVVEDGQVTLAMPFVDRALVTQVNPANYGLASISHRVAGATDYKYDSSAGENTHSYVVDTGIAYNHTDFGGRASFGYNAMEDNNDEDIIGHGTAVAAILGGTEYGVAKKTNIISVRVFSDTFGEVSRLIDGWDWAMNDIISKGRQNSSVINLSLESPYAEIWETASKAGFDAGVVSIAAAGNAGRNERKAPAACPGVISVGAVDEAFNKWEFSNFGASLDLFAPGVDITTARRGPTNDQTLTNSGTSFASPHVAGVAAYLQRLEGVAGPQMILDRLLALASKGVVQNEGEDSPNFFLYNGSGE